MIHLRRAVLAGCALALALAGAAPATAGAWRTSHEVDAVTGAVREGAFFAEGRDKFLVVCTRNGGSRSRFWIAVQTHAPLGRARTRPLTYRVGEDAPTTSNWDYTSRQATPAWPLEDKHIVQRVLAGDAQRLILQLTTYDGGKHDVSVPVDEEARRFMSATLASCGAKPS